MVETIPTNFDRERGIKLLTIMERIRAFEENAVLAAERDKLVLGAIHPSFGQEASAAGVIWPLRKDDYLISTHRGHGHTLAKGADPIAMMRELLGREGGCCRGTCAGRRVGTKAAGRGRGASWQRRDGLTGVSGDSNGMRFPNHGKVGVRFVWRRGRWRRSHPLDGIAF